MRHLCPPSPTSHRRLLEVLDVYKPVVWEYSRLNITNTMMSKRKLNRLVTGGFVDGWDDPRLLTLAGAPLRGVASPLSLLGQRFPPASRTPASFSRTTLVLWLGRGAFRAMSDTASALSSRFSGTPAPPPPISIAWAGVGTQRGGKDGDGHFRRGRPLRPRASSAALAPPSPRRARAGLGVPDAVSVAFAACCNRRTQGYGGGASRRAPSTTFAARSASRAMRTSSPCTGWSTTCAPTWTPPRRACWPC